MAAQEPGRGAGCGDGRAPTPRAAIVLLAAAVGYALSVCAGLTPDELPQPTPCTGWDLGTLLAHLCESMADLETGIRCGRLAPDWKAPHGAGGDVLEALRDRAADLLCTCYLTRGRFIAVGGLPVPAGVVACTGAVEIAVHGWDASAARGYDCPIPPALAERLLPLCPLLVTGRRGLFADPVQVPQDASPSDRLVGYLGRDPLVTG